MSEWVCVSVCICVRLYLCVHIGRYRNRGWGEIAFFTSCMKYLHYNAYICPLDYLVIDPGILPLYENIFGPLTQSFWEQH